MLTDDSKGIVCDCCGLAYKEKFTYFSLECTRIFVSISKRFTSPDIKPTRDIDVCESCFKDMKDKIIQNILPPSNSKLKCELCKNWYKDEPDIDGFYYFNVAVAEVEVDKDKEERGPANVIKDVLAIKMGIPCCYDEIMKNVDKTRIDYKRKINKQGDWDV